MITKYKLKILKIEEIYSDEKLYPRMSVSYDTYSKYLDAIKSGAKFPPIKVALRNSEKGKYALIDGVHRLKAVSELGQKYVSAEIYEGLTDKEIYQMSVEANATHGKPFDSVELRKIVERLDKEFKMSREEISQIVRMPLDKIDVLIVKEIVRDTPEEPFEARKSLYKHAGIKVEEDIDIRKIDEEDYLPVKKDIYNIQQEEAKAQLRIIESLIALLKDNAISKRDETISYQLEKLYELLQKRFEKK